MSRLRTVAAGEPGLTRVRRGRGFSYRSPEGGPIEDEATLDRIRALAIPPAWRDVWICADERGHLQALGTDDAGRQQYLYHPRWRSRRDAEKFRRSVAFAQVLPDVRREVQRDLRRRGMPRERALAAAIRLLDQAFFRIGSEDYAERNGSFGLATLRKSHVDIHGDRAVFDYTAKSGVRRTQTVKDPLVLPALRIMKDRQGGGRELLAYRTGDRWRDLRSSEINDHLKALAGDEFSSKDFRTWHATVLAATEIAAAADRSTGAASQRRLVTSTVEVVAEHLGNTPAVARRSYIDPVVFDRFREGVTVDPAWADARSIGPRARRRLELEVLGLLEDRRPR